MLNLHTDNDRFRSIVFSNKPIRKFILEGLEDRRLMSSSICSGGQPALMPDGNGKAGDAIEFSLAPTAIQNGLDTLATADGLTAPTSTSTQLVYLNNTNGVETYTMNFTSTGTTTQITVDQNGNPVTAPVKTTTTWNTLSGTGAGSNSAAAGEISAIATALGLTAPTSTTVVHVSTTSSGAVTYLVRLAGNSGQGKTVISVDSNGNPVGNESIPFSALPTIIQSGLNNNAPAGATAISSTSAQKVKVRTVDGVTTYSVTFSSSGTQSVVTVNAAGKKTSLPLQSTTTFSSLTSSQQKELQALATADGASTISQSQTVYVYDEANGTTIYSVRLNATGTDDSGASYTYQLSLSIDQSGNPTVPPDQEFGGSGFSDRDYGVFGTAQFGAGFGRRF